MLQKNYTPENHNCTFENGKFTKCIKNTNSNYVEIPNGAELFKTYPVSVDFWLWFDDLKDVSSSGTQMSVPVSFNPGIGRYRDCLFGITINYDVVKCAVSMNNYTNLHIIVNEKSPIYSNADVFKKKQWQHVYYCYDGEKVNIYVDGKSVFSHEAVLNTELVSKMKDMRLLSTYKYNYNVIGMMDEYCVRNYIPWTTEFTPPTSPYQL